MSQQRAADLLAVLGRHPELLPRSTQGLTNMLTVTRKVPVADAPQMVEYFTNHFHVLRFEGEVCVWDKTALEKLAQPVPKPSPVPSAPSQANEVPDLLVYLWTNPQLLPRTFGGLVNAIKTRAKTDDASATKLAERMVALGAVVPKDARLFWKANVAAKLVGDYNKVAAWVVVPPLLQPTPAPVTTTTTPPALADEAPKTEPLDDQSLDGDLPPMSQQRAANFLAALGRHSERLPLSRHNLVNVLTMTKIVSAAEAPQMIEYFTDHFRVLRFEGEVCVWDKPALQELGQSGLEQRASPPPDASSPLLQPLLTPASAELESAMVEPTTDQSLETESPESSDEVVVNLRLKPSPEQQRATNLLVTMGRYPELLPHSRQGMIKGLTLTRGVPEAEAPRMIEYFTDHFQVLRFDNEVCVWDKVLLAKQVQSLLEQSQTKEAPSKTQSRKALELLAQLWTNPDNLPKTFQSLVDAIKTRTKKADAMATKLADCMVALGVVSLEEGAKLCWNVGVASKLVEKHKKAAAWIASQQLPAIAPPLPLKTEPVWSSGQSVESETVSSLLSISQQHRAVNILAAFGKRPPLLPSSRQSLMNALTLANNVSVAEAPLFIKGFTNHFQVFRFNGEFCVWDKAHLAKLVECLLELSQAPKYEATELLIQLWTDTRGLPATTEGLVFAIKKCTKCEDEAAIELVERILSLGIVSLEDSRLHWNVEVASKLVEEHKKMVASRVAAWVASQKPLLQPLPASDSTGLESSLAAMEIRPTPALADEAPKAEPLWSSGDQSLDGVPQRAASILVVLGQHLRLLPHSQQDLVNLLTMTRMVSAAEALQLIECFANHFHVLRFEGEVCVWDEAALQKLVQPVLEPSQAPSQTNEALDLLIYLWTNPKNLPGTFVSLVNALKTRAKSNDTAAATKMAERMVSLGAVALEEDSRLRWHVGVAVKLVNDYKKVAAWVVVPPLLQPVSAAQPPAVAPASPKPLLTPAVLLPSSASVGLESKVNPAPTLVNHLAQLEALEAEPSWWSGESVVALDLEGAPSAISLIQIATPAAVYVFDTVTLDLKAVCDVLRPLLESSTVVKLLHDLHPGAQALSALAQVSLFNVLDTQLLAELLQCPLQAGFQDMLALFDNTLKRDFKADAMNGKLFAQRPLPAHALQCAVNDVKLLMQVWPSVVDQCEPELLGRAIAASNLRASLAVQFSGMRSVWFNSEYQLCSVEVLEGYQHEVTTMGGDLGSLLALLPEHLKRGALEDEAVLRDLVDVCLDKGRTALCYLSGKRRLNLGESEVLVTKEDIACVIAGLGGESRFGDDNRAGLERQLHRISAMRNNQRVIYGVTLRVGRFVTGLAECLCDLLLGQPDKSILFVGVPGSGKTTMIRDVARLVSRTMENTCIIDTSNEIGGDSDVPHECIGSARRMMVPSLGEQAGVMIECVQNHTVGTMVIDEIGRKAEVASALTVKQRGVRLIGSVHGDFRTLLKNKELNGLLGGVQSVTLGDAAAKQTGNKLQSERCGEPTFDVVVELGVDPASGDKLVRVIASTKDAVDAALRGERVQVQVRRRHASGRLLMELAQI